MKSQACKRCGGLSINGICISCGYRDETYGAVGQTYGKNIFRLAGANLTFWNFALLIIINAAFTATIVNLCVGGLFWAHYVGLGLFSIYFFVFAALSKNGKQVSSRIRNGVLMLNFLGLIFVLIMCACGGKGEWLWQYYMPVTVLLADILLLTMLVLRKTSINYSLVSYFIMFLQTLFPIIMLLAVGTAGDKIALSLIVCSSGITLLTCVNLLFLRVTRVKEKISDGFVFWE